MDTIYARASGVGQAGIAIIRLSGPQSLPILINLSGQDNWPARMLKRVWLKDEMGHLLDDALAVYFPKGQSYTGEDIIELHVHGGTAVLNAILTYLSQQKGLRLADAGEFTRRAFENGRMNLTEAEAVADIIHAETALQRKQALNQLGGSLSRIYEGWREQLIKALSWYEAHIDFSDEEIPQDLDNQVHQHISSLKQQMESHLGDQQRGEVLRSGVQLALIGAPNAGKSSLLNHITAEDASIISPIAGTTRDIIERRLDLFGFPVVIADTAGLRQTQDDVEREGIKRAIERAQQAHLVIALFDSQKPADEDTLNILSQCQGEILILRTKTDLAETQNTKIADIVPLLVNLKDKQTLIPFYHHLKEILEKICASGEDALITRQRHRQCVGETLEAIERFQQGQDVVLKAEDLRSALSAVGRLTGHVDVEQLLDVIFSDFCIGK